MNIFIFHRDLRVIDNIGLNYCFKNLDNVLPIFIFTPEQVTKNKYKSENAIGFMCKSLQELDIKIKKISKSHLHIFYDDNIKCLSKIIKQTEVKRILYNIDYTPYARIRDNKIKLFCTKHNIECLEFEDYLLLPINTIKKQDGNTYVVYTPFYNEFIKNKVQIPVKINPHNIIKFNFKNIKTDIIDKYDSEDGGRKKAIKILKADRDLDKTHNYLQYETTKLSAYIKFGCISIREVWHYFNSTINYDYIHRQLIWREFYYYIGYNFPKVLGYTDKLKKLSKNQDFNVSNYRKHKWSNNENKFNNWCNGNTGVDVVDAGMKQLNTTGFMHNRARMIVANYLVNVLKIDWRYGEQYFAIKLRDYDPLVNNGNWQFMANTGVNTKSYIFNMDRQTKKYDKNRVYINKYL